MGIWALIKCAIEIHYYYYYYYYYYFIIIMNRRQWNEGNCKLNHMIEETITEYFRGKLELC